MNYNTALKELRRIGCGHAAGDALRAMYAQLVSDVHGGASQTYYAHLSGSDSEMLAKAKVLLSDRAKAWDVLMGNAV